MIIVIITDIHGNTSPLNTLGKALSEADLVIIAGDLTHFGGEKEARQVIDAVSRYNNNILAVTGNCDTKEVDDYLSTLGINLHGRSVRQNGLNIVGAGGSLPCPSPTPNVYSEEEFAAIFEQSVEGTDNNAPMILVSHQPPLDTKNDMLTTGEHVGSRSVREFIEKYRPLVCFSGHIHEAPGIDEIGVTKIVNPGPLGTRSYAYLDIEDGEIKTLEIRHT